MKNRRFTKISMVSLLCMILLLGGCYIELGGCAMQAKYEKTVRLSAPLSAGSSFAATTHNGSITINGADVTDCNLTATIVARATTEEKARMLAEEEVEVTLKSSGNGLVVIIDRPKYMRNRSVSVSLDVTIPNKADLKLNTHNGSVKITDITGQIDATTHNGKINAEKVTGTTELFTHNGAVVCQDISGDTKLRSHNGRIKASYSESAPPVCDISLISHNGGIDLTAPPDYSAVVEVSTHNGSIDTNLPITLIGKISKSKLKGKIGKGEGKLYIETHNGSIDIR
jgi:DUF4097 and DUF4098 domain-containing protein YvlB